VTRIPVPALTGLRLIATLSIVIAHARELVAPVGSPVNNWLGAQAGFGMTLFFVLSGFVIHYNYGASLAHGSRTTVFYFLWVRFARLYPLFLLVVLVDTYIGFKRVLAGIYVADEWLTMTFQGLPYYLAMVQSWIYRMIGSRTLIYGMGESASLTWSISTEWFFYLAFVPAAHMVVRLKKARHIVSAALLICLIWGALDLMAFRNRDSINAWSGATFAAVGEAEDGFQESFFRWLLYFSPYMRLGEFLLGCFTAQLFLILKDREQSRRETNIGRGLILLAGLSIPMVLAGMYAFGGPLLPFSLNIGLAPSVAVMIFCLARYRTSLASFLSTRPIVMAGEASYSIYLLHVLVLQKLHQVVFSKISLAPLAELSVVVVAVVAVSLVSYAVFESPARRWLRSLFPRSGMQKPA
jgi:peptidoglycan/LPS O-acetylase OafA/YrhL